MNATPKNDEYDYYDSATDDYYDNFSLLFNSTRTEWCEAGEHELAIKVVQTCILFLAFPLGVMGNSLVIATFARYRNLDVFRFHLALADLLLLLTLPFQAIDTYLGWIFTDPLCKVTRACYAINTYSGLLLLACISFDRYDRCILTRAQPQKAPVRLTNKMLTSGSLVCLGVWLIALILSLPEILFSGVSGSGTDAYCGFKMWDTMYENGGSEWPQWIKITTYGFLIIAFSVSLSVMIVFYSAIGRVLCRRGSDSKLRHSVLLMTLLVLVFLFFQLPYTVVLARKMAGHFCAPVWEYITCTLAYTRCCLNPILYAMVGIEFRKDVRKIVCKIFHNASCRCGLPLEQRELESFSLRSMASRSGSGG